MKFEFKLIGSISLRVTLVIGNVCRVIMEVVYVRNNGISAIRYWYLMRSLTGKMCEASHQERGLTLTSEVIARSVSTVTATVWS